MTTRTDCRLCGRALPLQPVLSLTPTPPANEFVRAEDVGKPQDVFPLDVFHCQGCGHHQLPVAVDPERLFGNYVYVSGTSPVFVQHFQEYAEKMVRSYSLRMGHLVVDIGSNDGTLLNFFSRQGTRVLGVDPARDIADRATQSGIKTIPEFFTPELADRIIQDHGRAHLVVANNVFAHADNLDGITDGIHKLIATGGVFVFEVSYLRDVVEKTLFDTIYHEHVAYHTLGPLVKFFRKHGMKLIDAERIGTHGGSLRGYVASEASYRPVSPTLMKLLQEERDLGFACPCEKYDYEGTPPMEQLSAKIQGLKEVLTSRLAELKSQGKKIAAYGAPAKATTLMYHFGLGSDVIDFVVDDSPLKQGLFTPGKHVPVLPSSSIEELKPDYLLILAWNFADSIIKKNKSFSDRGGKFIVPIPDYREV